MKTKTIALSLGLAAVAGGMAYTITQAQAFGNEDRHQNMVQILAEKLGKPETEVKEAFSVIREEHREEVKLGFEGRLDEAVSNGEITEEQKRLILEKKEQMRTEFTAMGEQKEAHRAEFEQWAEDNGIDMDLFMGFGQGKRDGSGNGMGMRRGR
jgi:hypothetical protein